MNTRSSKCLYENERSWLFVGIGALVLALAFYVYFLSQSIMHVVVRKEIDVEYARLSSEVGALEARYIEAQHNVSEEIATRHGFTKTDKKIFIDRTTDALSLRSE